MRRRLGLGLWLAYVESIIDFHIMSSPELAYVVRSRQVGSIAIAR